jgi:hypothetical protein
MAPQTRRDDAWSRDVQAVKPLVPLAVRVTSTICPTKATSRSLPQMSHWPGQNNLYRAMAAKAATHLLPAELCQTAPLTPYNR